MTMLLLLGLSAVANEGPYVEVKLGHSPMGTVEVHGVAAGAFTPEWWEDGTLHWLPDTRQPLLAPKLDGIFRNIYAPSAVKTDTGWRLFYGGWDGLHDTNDRIYSIETPDFLTFDNRHAVIANGQFIHVCNVNALGLPGGGFEMMCTSYPARNGQNKPVYFRSPEGRTWNGDPAPHAADFDDLVTIEGYEGFEEADINGMNVILREDGKLRLYFCNFKDFGKVFRATSTDNETFTYEGVALEHEGAVNDVKKFEVEGDDEPWYLMGLHWNQDRTWYALSRDGLSFQPAQLMHENLGPQDRYIVAVGWVTDGERLLGVLYGAGARSSLDRNRIWARWLQKRVVFTAEDGRTFEAERALGPDRQIIEVPMEGEVRGTMQVYAADGVTPLGEPVDVAFNPGYHVLQVQTLEE